GGHLPRACGREPDGGAGLPRAWRAAARGGALAEGRRRGGRGEDRRLEAWTVRDRTAARALEGDRRRWAGGLDAHGAEAGREGKARGRHAVVRPAEAVRRRCPGGENAGPDWRRRAAVRRRRRAVRGRAGVPRAGRYREGAGESLPRSRRGRAIPGRRGNGGAARHQPQRPRLPLRALHRQLRAQRARQVLSNADLHRKDLPDLPDLGDLPDLPGGDGATVLRTDPELVRRVTGQM